MRRPPWTAFSLIGQMKDIPLSVHGSEQCPKINRSPADRAAALLARRVLPALLILISAQAGRADDGPQTCGSSVSILNENARFDRFDRETAASPRRVQFRLAGRERCGEHECRLETISRASATEKVIATVDLADRTVSYCLLDLKKVKIVELDQPKAGCPSSYLLNVMAIRLDDASGPYSRRDITINYIIGPLQWASASRSARHRIRWMAYFAGGSGPCRSATVLLLTSRRRILPGITAGQLRWILRSRCRFLALKKTTEEGDQYGETVEHPFSTLKMRMGATHLLMKTLPKVADRDGAARARL